ncbi:MAG: NADPH-dependent F420 reductase [Alphaproteobacteria bacterium]|nr:NADPH-dependent F420 reductase [Alphaproteobacteria bacterium]
MAQYRFFHRRDVLRLTGATAAAALAASPLRAFAQGAAGGAGLKIGMVGSGREGGALGTLWAKAGHPVMFSSRHPEELKGLVESAGNNAKAGAVADAVAFGDVIVVVVPYTAMAQIGHDFGTQLAAKRLVLDVSNPIARRDGEELVKQVDQEGGAGLATAKLLPGAHLVRGFNAIGSGRLAEDAKRQGTERVGVPIAGDDQNAIALASSLIREIGFEPVVVGGLAMGKYLVPGTPLGGEHTPAEIKQIAGTLH